MVKVKDITSEIEKHAPLSYQESYDNAGLMVGSYDMEVKGVLICVDITDEVLNEALSKQCNLIICHHPLIFGGLKKINGKSMVERCVIFAIKHDIALYAAHTNLDSAVNGVSFKMAEMLGLKDVKVLSPMQNELRKLVVFVPLDYAEKVKQALFKVGAGQIGKYDSCSFGVVGEGAFRAGDCADPFVGEKGVVHHEKELRIETVFPLAVKNAVINTLLSVHPYEEVAYDVYPIENVYQQAGMGAVGFFEKPVAVDDFFKSLKRIFSCGCIRHTNFTSQKISKVAMCGGAGSFLLRSALLAKADVFISGDFKYHDFFNAENKIIIADIGHYESEQYTKDIFYELIMKKNPKFAVFKTEVDTNPINYY